MAATLLSDLRLWLSEPDVAAYAAELAAGEPVFWLVLAADRTGLTATPAADLPLTATANDDAPVALVRGGV